MTIRIAFYIWPGPEANGKRCHTIEQHISRFADGVVIAPDRSGSLRLTVTVLREAAHRARTRETSHLAFITETTLTNEADLQRLTEACRSHPAALILGRRQTISRTGWLQRWVERSLPRFWLKIQTGRHLEDPESPLRVYPLAVIDHLRLFQGGKALDTELLVKSAWAEVPFHEVRLEADRETPSSL